MHNLTCRLTPNIILNGNVIANDIGIYIPALASGKANLIAAGTAIYEALEHNTVNNKVVPLSTPMI